MTICVLCSGVTRLDELGLGGFQLESNDKWVGSRSNIFSKICMDCVNEIGDWAEHLKTRKLVHSQDFEPKMSEKNFKALFSKNIIKQVNLN